MSEYFSNIFYGVKSFITGMKLTMNHFRNKEERVATLQYPHEKWPIPERNIGFDHSEYNLIRSRLHVDIDDCISCMQCEKVCPVDCIKIDAIKPPKDSDVDCGITSNDTQKKMIVSRFTIDMAECMYCNLCVFPCPEECIYMVGGPNAEKHEIDYEFSQYKRDGMIFEFADATDDMIRDAGGDKWLEQRDAKALKNSNGVGLMGVVSDITPAPAAALVAEVKTDIDKQSPKPAAATGELEINSFNDIADKMCRGIAKKAFMAAKRAGKDKTAILPDVAQALSDNGKMTSEIQSILDSLSTPAAGAAMEVQTADRAVGEADSPASAPAPAKEFDIKELNVIEDKMARGTAKKAFLAAKRSGEEKVDAVRKALTDAGLIDTAAEELLNSLSGSSIEAAAHPAETENPMEVPQTEPIIEPAAALPLFEITDLNGIEDKMSRGLAKKIFMAGKRAGKTSADVISDIRIGLTEVGKLDDNTAAILNSLENGN